MTRNMTIKWLKWIINMFPEDSEQRKALEYALSSLITDEAYQLEYERLSPNKKVFIELRVSYPKSAFGSPYYSIRYKENGEETEGYGTFDLEVLSKNLRDYFFSAFSIDDMQDNEMKDSKNPCNECEHRKTWCMGFLCKEALEYLDREDEDAR